MAVKVAVLVLCAVVVVGVVKAIPAPDRASCVCPMNYSPVCGDDGITYGNSCAARCAGVLFFHGRCDACGRCNRRSDPVCSPDDVTTVYSNPCMARCAGVRGPIVRTCSPAN